LRKTLIALVALLAIGLAGCTTSKDNANTQKYPQEAKDNFVDTCATERAGGDNKQNRDICGCIVTNLQDRQNLPYDRQNGKEASFKDVDVALKDGKAPSTAVSQKLKNAETACAGSR